MPTTPLTWTRSVGLLVAVACLLCSLTADLAAQRRPRPLVHSVYGAVRDVETGSRLPGARVQLVGDDEQVLADTTTDDAGRYILQAPNPGPYRLQVELPGYPSTRTTVQVPERQVVEVRWHLAHNAPQQTSVEVHAFGTSGCDEWSDRERLSGSVGSLLEW